MKRDLLCIMDASTGKVHFFTVPKFEDHEQTALFIEQDLRFRLKDVDYMYGDKLEVIFHGESYKELEVIDESI